MKDFFHIWHFLFLKILENWMLVTFQHVFDNLHSLNSEILFIFTSLAQSSAKGWEPSQAVTHQSKALPSQLQSHFSADVEKCRILRNFPQICGGHNIARTYAAKAKFTCSQNFNWTLFSLHLLGIFCDTWISLGLFTNYLQVFLYPLKYSGSRIRLNIPVSASLMLKPSLCCHPEVPVCTPRSCSPSAKISHWELKFIACPQKPTLFFYFLRVVAFQDTALLLV